MGHNPSEEIERYEREQQIRRNRYEDRNTVYKGAVYTPEEAQQIPELRARLERQAASRAVRLLMLNRDFAALRETLNAIEEYLDEHGQRWED